MPLLGTFSTGPPMSPFTFAIQAYSEISSGKDKVPEPQRFWKLRQSVFGNSPENKNHSLIDISIQPAWLAGQTQVDSAPHSQAFSQKKLIGEEDQSEDRIV